MTSSPSPRRSRAKQATPEKAPAAACWVAVRPLHVGGKQYFPGDPVPGVESWPRRESWERARWIRKAD